VIKALISWSGGKDSAWTLERLRRRSDVEVVGLFTTVYRESGEVAVHRVPTALLRAQARAAQLEVHEIEIPSICPNTVYERALADFVDAMKGRGVTHIAFGDLFLEDIRAYRERQFRASGVELLFPLWGADTRALAREMTGSGLRAWITCVDTAAAPAEWAGRVYDAAFVEQISAPVDPCGENGEFHTFVFDGPMLRHRTDARVASRSIGERWAYAHLVQA
jgi:uncharacterized protein (TIGR00290 family)